MAPDDINNKYDAFFLSCCKQFADYSLFNSLNDASMLVALG
jgi:hypothetical protein